MLISIIYQIILIIGESVLLCGFKLGDGVPDVYVVDSKYPECRYDEDFIFYDRHEGYVDIVMILVDLLS